jgi:hypothetical protein
LEELDIYFDIESTLNPAQQKLLDTITKLAAAGIALFAAGCELSHQLRKHSAESSL